MLYRSPFPTLSARAFYRDFLGFGTPLYDLLDPGWVEFACGAPSGNVAIVKADQDWQPGTGTTIVLNTENCHAAVAELRARGAQSDDPVVFPGYVTYCSFHDPFGNVCKWLIMT